MARTLAHEVKNPLTPIQLTVEDSNANEEIHRALGLIESFSADADVEDQVITSYSMVGTAKTQNANAVAYSSIIVA